MEKWYGKISVNKLKSIQATLKQELAIESQKLKRRKTVQERRRINGLFKVAPKKVYRFMKGDGGKSVSEMPTKQRINNVWGSLWSIPVLHNSEAPWLEKLRQEYCVTAEQKDYETNDEILDKVPTKMANDKPGRDLIAGIWIKNMQSIREMRKRNLRSMLNNLQEPPDWLVTAKTIPISKNEEIHKPENYRPIEKNTKHHLQGIYRTYS